MARLCLAVGRPAKAGAGVVPFNPGSDIADITRHILKSCITNLIGNHLWIPGAGVAGHDL